MGNSVIALLFSTHNFLHSRTITSPWLRQIISLLGLTMLWMPPTLWKAVHNREHHNKTNSLEDPDRNYLDSQPKNWGKWIQNAFVPSAEVNPLLLFIGMGHAWGVHAFRNLTSVLLFNNGKAEYPVMAFTVSGKERRAIAIELLIMIGIHGSILTYLEFHPIKLLLGYFLPIWIGYAGLMFYIYTNHMLCRMISVNDPLINSLSIRVPKPSGLVRRYSSWSSFAAGELGERAVIDAVVADLIMRAHEWRLAIGVEDRCVACHIFIPPLSTNRDERQRG
jgi:fatty acid desaturase